MMFFHFCQSTVKFSRFIALNRMNRQPAVSKIRMLHYFVIQIISCGQSFIYFCFFQQCLDSKYVLCKLFIHIINCICCTMLHTVISGNYLIDVRYIKQVHTRGKQVLQTVDAVSALDCARLCTLTVDCYGYQYSSIVKTCQRVSSDQSSLFENVTYFVKTIYNHSL